MAKPTHPAEYVAPPEDLSQVLRSVGLGATLAIVRLDGAPLTDHDRATLPSLLKAYALGRELQPSDDEMAAAAAQIAEQAAAQPKATGTGGE